MSAYQGVCGLGKKCARACTENGDALLSGYGVQQERAGVKEIAVVPNSLGNLHFIYT